MPAGSLGVLALGWQAGAPIPVPIAGVCLLVNPVLATVVFPNLTQGFAAYRQPMPQFPFPPFGIATQWGSFDPATGQFAASLALVF